MNRTRIPNRLAREKSPYLLQHASNPVDWYPWGEEAFARARTDGKPLFLSIGYSTCHWCHVMERESFENEEIAALLNSMFVPVKVDREERPDVDRIFMTALQAMGQQGGWPLSMFLTPDLRPFYGGTYFPPVSRYGRAGFPDVLRRIHELWTEKRETVLESATGIAGFLREISTRPASGTDGTRSPLTGCYEMVRRTYDPASGGFGGGPKFPRPVVFDALLRYHHRTGEPEALMMVTDTLHAIARGGIADHLGGGFHRYAVDAEWRVPHFEKMLYDQAQLATAFLDAHLVTGDAAFAEAARGIFTYVLRDLTHPLGGFTSAEDADSLRPGSDEQGEGAFYVWTRAAVMNELGEAEGALFCEAYGVEEEGNAPFDPQHEFTGLNILYRAADDEELASSLGSAPEDVRARLARSRDRLLALRAARPRPLLDDKIITSWNGLMIGAFARGFRVLREPAYREAAVRSARFVRSTLSGDGGKTLFRRWREGEARFEGQLDDYAYLAAGLLELHEATLEPEWLLWAADLARTMVDRFHDPEHGGFFDSPGTDASILARLKESYDGAEPSGNAAAAGVLARLSAMTGNEEWRSAAAESLRFFGRLMDEQPHAMPAMAGVADLMADPPRTAVIAGPPRREDTQLLARLVHGHFEPNRVVLGVEGEGSGPLAALAPYAASLLQKEGRPTLYLCENFTCSLPVNDPADAARLLQGGLPR